MTLVDHVRAAARTLAELTHMDETAAMGILDLLVYMDQQAMATLPEQEQATAGSFPAMITTLCASDLAQGSPVCAAWQKLSEGEPIG
jgi:hypothetical protein